jgi:hypothetical protein
VTPFLGATAAHGGHTNDSFDTVYVWYKAHLPASAVVDTSAPAAIFQRGTRVARFEIGNSSVLITSVPGKPTQIIISQ